MSLEKLATIVSSLTALLLVVIKLIVGIISSSISVLSSAIDSMLDLFVSVFNFFAIKNSEKPTDAKFNYGRWKMEALAWLFEWIIITLSGLYIMYESVMKLIHKEQIAYLNEAIYVMLVSIVITWALVTFLSYVAKKTNNIVIKWDALHYKTDLFSNMWIIIALTIIYFTWAFYVDAIVWIIVAIYIIYSAYGLVHRGFLLLLDVSLKEEEVEKIRKIIKSQQKVNDFHFLKTRSSWRYKFVDVHVVFNPLIKLVEAHKVWDKIEDEIKKIDKKKNWIINIHLDPYDDSAQNEEKCNVFYDRA